MLEHEEVSEILNVLLIELEVSYLDVFVLWKLMKLCTSDNFSYTHYK